MRIFIGMETSGETRRRLDAKGHHVISCDMLPSEDAAEVDGILHCSGHWRGDVFKTIEALCRSRWVPDVALFHPTCTYHTLAAAWAFNEPNFGRYPGVGYHQKVNAKTLTGAARRNARDQAEADCERIKALPFPKIIENPKGTLPTRTSYGKAHQTVQPYEHGDDASKGTCLWFFDEYGNQIPGVAIPVDPAKRIAGRIVEWPRGSGKMVERWANQTDSGQNNVTPEDGRWKARSKTYPGVAAALAEAVSRMAHG